MNNIEPNEEILKKNRVPLSCQCEIKQVSYDVEYKDRCKFCRFMKQKENKKRKSRMKSQKR